MTCGIPGCRVSDCQDMQRLLKAQREGCAHPEIIEDVRFPDGSIDGRCTACGERGFPIRDVAWEEFRALIEKGEAP